MTVPPESQGEGPGDGEVVRAVLDGHREMYRILVRRYEEPLFLHARRMVGGDDLAADMVQRAFVKGFRKLRTCREPEKVGGWLYRITSNLCKDHLKSRRQDDVSLEDAPPLSSERGDPDEALERRELREEIEAALDRLTPDQREAFLLKHLEGRSYTEMSEILDASVSALKMRVHRARDELQTILRDHV